MAPHFQTGNRSGTNCGDLTRLGHFIRLASTLSFTVLLAACADAQPQPSGPTISQAELGEICSHLMGFDVSGQYYFKCREYLKVHGRPDAAPVLVQSETAEHQACHRVGLEDGTPEYDDCVATMYRYDFGSIHL